MGKDKKPIHDLIVSIQVYVFFLPLHFAIETLVHIIGK